MGEQSCAQCGTLIRYWTTCLDCGHELCDSCFRGHRDRCLSVVGRPAWEYLRRVITVCRQHKHLVEDARRIRGNRGSSLDLLRLIHPRPRSKKKKALKHGTRRMKRWQRQLPYYRHALEWWLQQDAITQLAEIGRLR